MQIEGEFPELLPIRESLIQYVFEPNAKKVRQGMQPGLASLALRSKACRFVHEGCLTAILCFA